MGDSSGKGNDCDIVQLPSAWTMEYRRAKREIQLESIWEAHARPYSGALGNGSALFSKHVQQGDWALENWVVEDLFLEGHIGLLVADAGTGKSLAALDLMIAAVSGGRWLNHFEVMTTPVVYLAGEGKIAENTSHVMGLLLGRGDEHDEFMRRYSSRVHLITPPATGLSAAAPLSDDAWWANIQALVTSTLPKEARPRLWIFDPLMALINSVDKADDVRPFIARCRWLAEQTAGYGLLVHHTKKDQGAQLSRRAKIRGESMWTNLCDDVLYMETDSEDQNLIHLYANKLKRGPTDDTKPLCHIARSFVEVSQNTFDRVLEEVEVKRTGEESPRALKQITMRYIPYTAELHRKEDESGDVEAPKKERTKASKEAAPTDAPSKGNGAIDTSSWDVDQKNVWQVLLTAGELLTVTEMQRELQQRFQSEASTTKIQTRFDALEALGLVSHDRVKHERGRPGNGYAINPKIRRGDSPNNS